MRFFAESPLLKYSRLTYTALRRIGYYNRGRLLANRWDRVKANGGSGPAVNNGQSREPSPIERYFESHTTGRGIFKWRHYFDIYHHHLQKFVGRPVHLLEIGCLGGGSLEMWKHYLGPKCHVYGVDIASECLAYRGDKTEIFIGDQANRGFWNETLKKIPRLDVVIDDGGHTADQQIVTLEETLPALSPGGVYLCEDVHGVNNRFTSYVLGLQDGLNFYQDVVGGELLASHTSPFQRFVASIHLYPYVIVIERASGSQAVLEAPKRGTEWLVKL